MAVQTLSIDPNATSLSDNQVVDKINTATNQITRADSVDAAARPIGAGEVGSTEIADGSITSTDLDSSAARDNLKAMSPLTREVILTNPQSGEFPVLDVKRDASGNLIAEYDDVPIA